MEKRVRCYIQPLGSFPRRNLVLFIPVCKCRETLRNRFRRAAKNRTVYFCNRNSLRLPLVRVVLFDSGKRIKSLNYDVFDSLPETGVQHQHVQLAAALFCNDLPMILYVIAVFYQMIQFDDEKRVTDIQLFK